jgi:hypothetical protein
VCRSAHPQCGSGHSDVIRSTSRRCGASLGNATCRRGVLIGSSISFFINTFCALCKLLHSLRRSLPSRATFRLTAGYSTSTGLPPPARGWQRRSYYLVPGCGHARGSGSRPALSPRSLRDDALSEGMLADQRQYCSFCRIIVSRTHRPGWTDRGYEDAATGWRQTIMQPVPPATCNSLLQPAPNADVTRSQRHGAVRSFACSALRVGPVGAHAPLHLPPTPPQHSDQPARKPSQPPRAFALFVTAAPGLLSTHYDQDSHGPSQPAGTACSRPGTASSSTTQQPSKAGAPPLLAFNLIWDPAKLVDHPEVPLSHYTICPLLTPAIPHLRHISMQACTTASCTAP